MGDFWYPWILVSVFCLGSLPLVAADIEDMEIPVTWLVGFFVAVAAVAGWGDLDRWVGGCWGSSAVLLVGGVLLKSLPQRLGEADVVYVAAFPFVFPFYAMLVALGLACAGGMVWFSGKSLVNRSWDDTPVPFVPLLFWGAVCVVLVGGVLL